MSVNEVLEAVRTMSPEERARVRALLEVLPAEPGSPEEQAQQNLYEPGLLVETEPRRVPAGARHTPVPIEGKPLSETVIEERG
jgi:hypothetical protein